MKPVHFLLAVTLMALTACSTTKSTTATATPHRAPVKPAADTPETVIVTYHIQAGREAEFPALLSRAWGIYRQEHLVRSEPHVVVREGEADGKTRFVEIFTWVSHAAPERASGAVQTIWGQEMSVCEARNGHRGLEGGEVGLVIP